MLELSFCFGGLIGAFLWFIFGDYGLAIFGIPNRLEASLNELNGTKANAKKLQKELDQLQKVNANLEQQIFEREVQIKEAEDAKKRTSEYYQSQDIRNYENQLRFVDTGELFCANVINREAYKMAFKPIEDCVKKNFPGHRVLAEVGMGAFMKTPKSDDFGKQKNYDNAFGSINSKRVDFLIIDHLGKPVLAVEYQGAGHFGNTAESRKNAQERDRVKKLALEKAKIVLLEIECDTPTAQVNAMIKHALKRAIVEAIHLVETPAV